MNKIEEVREKKKNQITNCKVAMLVTLLLNVDKDT